MIQVRTDLVTLLLASSDVTDVIQRKVYAGLAPQTVEMPYITFLNSDIEPLKAHDQNRADSPMADRYLFTVFVWSEDADQAAVLAESVVVALDGQRGDGTDLFQFDGGTELADFRADNSGKVIHQFALNFITRRLSA